ncbi:MAG TPA: ACP S-malonyltransferase [Bacteroidota bacterium]
MAVTAWLFPGQGSQYVGMAAEWAERDERARALVARADRILGFPLSEVMFRGPEQELRQTRNTQPAIFLHSMIAVTLLAGEPPAMAAGHSLGEYTALVAAGALSFEDGLRLVRLRGELMQRAGETAPGTMAAVVGLEPAGVEAVCREASAAGIVQPANFNAPGQVVISGSVDGVHRAMELAKQRGAKMVKELVVSGAFHSPLMQSAQEGLRTALGATRFTDARLPVYTNVQAEPVTRAEEIRALLLAQLTSPVRWEELVRHMARDGARRFLEVGPGKVLQGLVRRIEPTAELSGIDRYADLPKD